MLGREPFPSPILRLVALTSVPLSQVTSLTYGTSRSSFHVESRLPCTKVARNVQAQALAPSITVFPRLIQTRHLPRVPQIVLICPEMRGTAKVAMGSMVVKVMGSLRVKRGVDTRQRKRGLPRKRNTGRRLKKGKKHMHCTSSVCRKEVSVSTQDTRPWVGGLAPCQAGSAGGRVPCPEVIAPWEEGPALCPVATTLWAEGPALCLEATTPWAGERAQCLEITGWEEGPVQCLAGVGQVLCQAVTMRWVEGQVPLCLALTL